MNGTELRWEPIKLQTVYGQTGDVVEHGCMRARVPGGWLVLEGERRSFVEDPSHTWHVAD